MKLVAYSTKRNFSFLASTSHAPTCRPRLTSPSCCMRSDFHFSICLQLLSRSELWSHPICGQNRGEREKVENANHFNCFRRRCIRVILLRFRCVPRSGKGQLKEIVATVGNRRSASNACLTSSAHHGRQAIIDHARKSCVGPSLLHQLFAELNWKEID
jgi:hypothetical protein